MENFDFEEYESVRENGSGEEQQRFYDRWMIDDDNKADWAVRKIKELEAERDRIVEIARAQIAELEKRIATEEANCEKQKAFFVGHLYEYFGKVPHRETKTQASYKLPSGSLVLRRGGLATKVDDSVLLQWCDDNGADYFVNVTRRPAWSAIKKQCEITPNGVLFGETGEFLPGVTVTEAEDKFDIK